MKALDRLRIAGSFMAGICLLFLASFAYAADNKDETYLINPGDVLSISVWREEGLQVTDVLVRPDGYISFPLAGNLKVAGKNVSTISQEMTSSLTKYIPDPVVHVAIKALSGNVVYVIGKVNRPGVFPMVSHVDVVQALSMAGGMTPYAAANKVRVLRREGDRQTAIPFAYGDIEKGESLEQNIILKAGDVVVVP